MEWDPSSVELSQDKEKVLSHAKKEREGTAYAGQSVWLPDIGQHSACGALVTQIEGTCT